MWLHVLVSSAIVLSEAAGYRSGEIKESRQARKMCGATGQPELLHNAC